MASDYEARSKAAGKLRKGRRKEEIPDEDLGLPPMDPAEAEGGGVGMDLASLLGAGGAGAPPSGEPELPGGGEGAPETGGQTDLEMALAGVDSAIGTYPREVAEQIRSHLNAIRQLAAGDAESPSAPMDTPPSQPAGMGMENPESGVIPA